MLYLPALVLAIATEVSVISFFTRKKQVLLAYVFINCITHALIHIAILVLHISEPIGLIVTILEALVVMAEACLLKLMSDLSWRTCFIATAIANIVSYFLGLFLL